MEGRSNYEFSGSIELWNIFYFISSVVCSWSISFCYWFGIKVLMWICFFFVDDFFHTVSQTQRNRQRKFENLVLGHSIPIKTLSFPLFCSPLLWFFYIINVIFPTLFRIRIQNRSLCIITNFCFLSLHSLFLYIFSIFSMSLYFILLVILLLSIVLVLH